MIRPICRMGNPVLREQAELLSGTEVNSEQTARLIEDLRDSMKHYGGIGIAAPQIGISKQICVIELGEINRYGQTISLPFTVFINPKIEELTDEVAGYWEGCLSVPGLRGYVERVQKLKVTYFNERYELCELVAEGFLATVIQHELDHLFGTLYIDRVKDPTKLVFQEEYEQFILKA